MRSLKGSNANGLEWWDFNVDFHSSTLDINKKEYENIVENNPQKIVDLRPYMIPRPFTVFENDCLQKCLD
jgi:hypothetical protein